MSTFNPDTEFTIHECDAFRCFTITGEVAMLYPLLSFLNLLETPRSLCPPAAFTTMLDTCYKGGSCEGAELVGVLVAETIHPVCMCEGGGQGGERG